MLLADLNAEAGEALAAELPRAGFMRVDVSCEEEVKALVDLAVTRHGRLDCMINNAGLVGAIGPIADTSAQDWRRALAVLLDGVFFGVKHAAAAMIPRGGAILNLSSIAGLTGGLGPHAYTTAKHGVIGLTRSAGSELARHGIRSTPWRRERPRRRSWASTAAAWNRPWPAPAKVRRFVIPS